MAGAEGRDVRATETRVFQGRGKGPHGPPPFRAPKMGTARRAVPYLFWNTLTRRVRPSAGSRLSVDDVATGPLVRAVRVGRAMGGRRFQRVRRAGAALTSPAPKWAARAGETASRR